LDVDGLEGLRVREAMGDAQSGFYLHLVVGDVQVLELACLD
jgi:hypothetical protein